MPQITPRTSLVGAVLVAVSTVLLTPAATQAASAPRPSLQTQIRTELTAALLNTIGSDRTGKTPFTVLITTPSPTTIVITSDGFGHIGLKLLTQGLPALEGFVDYTDNGSMYETSPLASTPTLVAALLELGQTGVHWVKFNAGQDTYDLDVVHLRFGAEIRNILTGYAIFPASSTSSITVVRRGSTAQFTLAGSMGLHGQKQIFSVANGRVISQTQTSGSGANFFRTKLIFTKSVTAIAVPSATDFVAASQIYATKAFTGVIKNGAKAPTPKLLTDLDKVNQLRALIDYPMSQSYRCGPSTCSRV